MAYSKQNFVDRQVLTHIHLNNIEDGIVSISNEIDNKVECTSDGMASLFASGQTVLSSNQYGSALPSSASEGTMFFKKATGTVADMDTNLVSELMLKAYPVGSVYMSMDATSPAELFGGTWQKRTDRFLVAAGNAYEAGATGGSGSVTLTVDQIPSHTHIAANYESMVGWEGSSPSRSYLNNTNDGYVGSNNPTTKATGGGQAHENRPPYLAVYMWIRTA